ncbi:MAG: DNA-binding transcriptional regulator OxyR [Bacteroidetes bacterium]|nr:MAG: DNA-binding transcriptional regulator OxyR [Bacteroidota bacterium]
MQINQLHYFVVLEKYGSFSKAAEKLNISQPALSLQMQRLEEELGYKLLNRNRKPFCLTAEGTLFLERACRIVNLVDGLYHLAIETAEEVSGYLRVGIIPTVAPYIVPLFMNTLLASYPKLHLEIMELKTEEITNKLKRGDIDCGLLATPIKNNKLLKRPLFYERFYLYVSDKHPLYAKEKVSIMDINLNELWYLQEGNCFQNQVDSICQLAGQTDKEQHLVYLSNSIESLRRIVEHKNGITFIPELATINVPSDLEDLIKPIGDSSPLREISMVTTAWNTKERQVEALTEMILQNIPKSMRVKPEGFILDTLV